ncbi:excinuclease ABC subunit C [bacterium]|nr:excinuclease ABC subunit C [bacterium]
MNPVEEKLKRTPQKPGVYLLKKSDGTILYVGKARQLRSRLRSHFKPGNNEDARHRRLMQQVTAFETIITDSEVEALIMEANFVKEHRPRYNIDLKDDKSYPFIRVTSDPYPKIFITRTIVRDGSAYYGPYTDAGALRQLMNAVRKIFPLRTCNKKLDGDPPDAAEGQVCLNHHIGRCAGVCIGRIGREEYAAIVDQATAFIKGEDSRLLRELERRMREKAADKKFEEAARLRDEITSIQAFRNRQKVVDAGAMDRDLVTVAAKDGEACGMVFNVREGKIINRKHYFLRNTDEAGEAEIVASFLKQYYLDASFVPSEILLQTPLADLDSVERWLAKKKGGKVSIAVPLKGRKARLMEMCADNAMHVLDDYLLQKAAFSGRVPGPVAALQKDLGLARAPLHIEAVDISNTQGEDSVASLVVFENGKPKKSAYRKYRIKTVEGADDFQSIAEVVRRRFTRLLAEDRPLPDLLMVDGGKGQLSAAAAVLAELGLQDQPVIGLAKRLEEVYVPGIAAPQNIPKHSPGLHLLQRLRDEAHRFALAFHRDLRGKQSLASLLDAVPGVGVKRRQALFKRFGSVAAMRRASPAELAAVPGMTGKAAAAVAAALQPGPEETTAPRPSPPSSPTDG